MKIILISAIPSDIGPCTISALLKAKGHAVNLLSMPELLENCLRPLPDKTTANVIKFIKGADLIGVNGFSENYNKTAILVDCIKKAMKTPIIWGGIHATLSPQDCIEHADIVCVGEGEEAMLELVEKLESGARPWNIRNLLFRSGKGTTEKIELRPPVNLDSLLPLDYDLSSQYIMENSKIRNLNELDFKGYLCSYTSRGCPFGCSYCCNSVILSTYKGQRFCRQRNIEHAIKELKEIKKRFSSCKMIWFNEADFLTGKTQKEIEHFSRRYKEEIDLPFSIWSHPNAITDGNIRTLKDAGLKGMNIGTVTGSDRIQRQIYRRNATPEDYRIKGGVLNKYGIVTEYDLILCNPYENDNDLINTIELLIRLPKPFRVAIQYLTYFKRTELYKYALRDGIIKENQYTHSYRKAAYQVWKYRGKSAYLNIVLSLMRGEARRINLFGVDFYGIFLPEPLLKFLIKRRVVKFFEYLPFRSLICRGIANIILIGEIVVKKMSYLARHLRRRHQLQKTT